MSELVLPPTETHNMESLKDIAADSITRLDIESLDLTVFDNVTALQLMALHLHDRVESLRGDIATLSAQTTVLEAVSKGTPRIEVFNVLTPDAKPTNRFVGDMGKAKFGYREAIAFSDDIGYNLPVIVRRAVSMCEQAFKSSMVGPPTEMGDPSWSRAPRFDEGNRLNVQVWIEAREDWQNAPE